MSIASLYPSINPSLLLDFANSKVLDPRITFTRTTTATYYDGVTTAVAEQNLLTYSQEFDDASWTKGNVTVTANSATVAPDGTTTADLFYPSSTGTWRMIYKSGIKANIQYTLTVYAKAAGFSNFFVGFDNQTTTVAWFNLTTGVKGTKGSSITSSDMTSVGNGWYRCQVVFTVGGVSFALFGVADADNSSTATASGTNGALIWGAQAEERSSATAYTATTSQAITNYIPVLQTAAAGQARFDHNPTTGESLGLLIEEARTNACPYSEAIGSWTSVNATAQSNVAIAPSGALTADKILPNATASVAHGWYNTITAAASTTYTTSIFAKAAEYSWLYLTEGNNVTATAYFNLSTGALGTVTGTGSPSATITSVGNGWYRCSLTFTTAVGATEANIQARVTTADNTTSFTASSSTVGYSGIFVWGGQFETGSFATSYIPNLSTGSTTRNADAASMTGTNFSSWFNNGEGTLYGEGVSQPSLTTVSGGNAATIANIDTGTTENALPRLARNNGGTGRYAYYVNGQYQAQFTDLGTWSNSTNGKLIGVYKANDFAASFNGGAVQTDNTGVLGVADRINIGRYGADGYWNSTIKKIAYYPIRVTNTQLQALTV